MTLETDCTSKVKVGPPSGHKPQLEENKRDTPFQKTAYQDLSLDIKAPSHGLPKTLPLALECKDHTIKS